MLVPPEMVGGQDPVPQSWQVREARGMLKHCHVLATVMAGRV